MPFRPRSKDEILQSMIARIVNVTQSQPNAVPLTDVAEGGVLHTVLGAAADEMMLIEGRAFDMTRGHSLSDEVKGELLYDAVADFPVPFPGPKGARPARGGNPILVRDSTVAELRIPPGGLVLGRNDNPNITAENLEEIVLDIGQGTYPGPGDPPITMEAKAPGTDGNAAPGVYSRLIAHPSTVVQAV